MNFLQTAQNTWTISIPEILMIGFDKKGNSEIIEEGFLEIDFLEGSSYDSDGDEKRLLLKFENNTMSFETLPEDYEFWRGTEHCCK